MRQSHLFSKVRKEAPADEVAENAKLLIRAGFIHKEMAGVYDYLPLGLRVRNNIVAIIRDEMTKLGAVEISLSALQEKELWEKTGRWSDASVDSWFKTELKNGSSLGLGFTHEEPIARLMTNHIQSYKDLPVYAFQIQTKFRNEKRAKSGIMRGREFLMKDLYSFSKDEKEHAVFYERAKEAYKNIFTRIGIGDSTYETFASGGVFAPYSHEFQTVCDAGEDIIYVDEETGIAVNKEVYTDDVLRDLGLDKEKLKEQKSIEVGNIFSLGTRFSEPLGLVYKSEEGKRIPVVMGSYGIGPDRLMGTIVELFSNEEGVVWPDAVAPFDVHLIGINPDNDTAVEEEIESVYTLLQNKKVNILLDDRDIRAGEKFAESDLIGIPKRIVVSAKTCSAGAHEVYYRKTKETQHLSKELL